MPDPKTVHFPPPAPTKVENERPDISLLRSMVGASSQIRFELREIGDESTYLRALRILKTQGQLIADLAEKLIQRYESSK